MMQNVYWCEFSLCADEQYGSLVPIEAQQTVPFAIKRIYYIFDVPESVRRGFHAHTELEQVLICVHGSVKLHLETPYEQQEVLLDDPAKGLYIGTMIWREMYDFSQNAVLLVLASDHYRPEEYLRDHIEYTKMAKELFAEKDLSKTGI